MADTRTKACLVCGKEFSPTGHNQKYCSPECRGEAIKARRREHYRRHKDEINAYHREYHMRNKDRINARQREYWRRRKDELNARRRGEKPKGCGFGGSCLECPYPECVEE